MKRLLYLILSIGIMTTFFCGCDKPEEEDKKPSGSIYGVVTNKATGEPVKSAGVELMPLGLKTVTGNNGQFEFVDIAAGKYNLYITKTGYAELKSNNITVVESQQVACDLQIEKLPAALRIIDDKNKDIDILEFGDKDGDNSRLFNIFNDGPESIDWQIMYTAEWIQSITPKEGKLAAGVIQGVVIIIDRTKLTNGDNVSTVHIISNNGNKQLKITASRLSALITLDATEITDSSAVLNGRINYPSSDFSEYGFVYGNMPTPSFDNGATRVAMKGYPQVGEYSIYIADLTPNIPYYVRAYLSGGLNTDVQYGKTKSFTVIKQQPFMVITELNLMVQTEDLGSFYYYDGDRACKNSIVSGYNWRLPTLGELQRIYLLRDVIGGFKNTCYWSSDYSDSDNKYKYCINFGNGESRLIHYNNMYRVRAVRTITK